MKTGSLIIASMLLIVGASAWISPIVVQQFGFNFLGAPAAAPADAPSYAIEPHAIAPEQSPQGGGINPITPGVNFKKYVDNTWYKTSKVNVQKATINPFSAQCSSCSSSCG
jgi:hypothetical protein